MNGKYRHRVVIVGAGFGGITLARALRRQHVEVLLIDRNNYHTFQPLLYQVATAGLEPEEIAYAVRDIFQGEEHVNFRLGEVVAIDRRRRAVVLADGDEVPYDYLVMAAGATNNFFGIPGVEEHGYPMKSLSDAVSLRSHIIRQFEAADRDPSAIEDGVLNFVVVGGGPTGVETAGALVELFDLVLRKDYRQFDVGRARVLLVEMAPDLLGSYDTRLRDYTRESLVRRGVEVLTATSVTAATSSEVYLSSGEVIPTRTLVWAAGVRANPLGQMLDSPLTRGGRVVVGSDLSLPDDSQVFVIGDMCGFEDAEGNQLPQVAPVAIQQAEYLARVIASRIAGTGTTQEFQYVDKGSMATIGRNAAVAQVGRLKLRGWFAWAAWLVLHLVQLIGFRNRMNVLINWTWNYFTYDRSARLIIDPPVAKESSREIQSF